MTILIIGMTIGLIGNILLGVAVIRVHMHMAREKKFDSDVARAIKGEEHLGTVAIILMIVGYGIEAAHFLGFLA